MSTIADRESGPPSVAPPSPPAAAAAAPALPGRLGALLERPGTADAAVATGVAALLSWLAFAAQGGVAIEPNTYAQVLLVAGGGLLAAIALAAPRRHEPVKPLHGAATLAAFIALALFTALSVIWSLAPSDSWIESNRTFSYLGAFAGALALARLAPGRWAGVVHGVGLAAVIVCGYALLTKVFPQALAEEEIFARLRAPFGYWNSVGLMAATGIPPLLWLGARRSGHAPVNALAYPAIGLLLVCLMLSYSRGALLALLAGLAVWFVLVPLRLRGAVVMTVAAIGAAAVVAWAFGQPGLTEDRLTALDRSEAGHQLGLLLALMVVLLLAAGLAIGFAAAYRAPTPRMRETAGRLVIGTLALALVAGVIGLATAPGGISGQVSSAWTKLTDPNAETPANTPNRLTATASVRARYWREAFKVHATSPVVGVGAGGYATARKRFRTSDLDVQHAHGYVVQVLADLGWAGLLISLAALVAWLLAAARALGLRDRPDRERLGPAHVWDAERVGLTTLAVVVLVFGIHSLLDWTWFVPANAVAALICAGWVAGRGPLRERLAAEGPSGTIVAAERAGVLSARRRWRVRERLVSWSPDPYRSGLAVAVLVTAMAVCWTIVQPLRAVHAGDAAIARMQANAFEPAADIARIGTERNPLSVEPLWELATAQAALGRTREAHETLERAAALQPANAEAWRRLGRYRLNALGDAPGALRAFRAAYYLDPHSPSSTSDVLEASRAVQAAGSP